MADLEKEIVIGGDETLPFYEKKQDALVGHCLTNEQFFLQARHKLQPKWFSNAWSSLILGGLQKFFNDWSRMPKNLDELKSTTHWMAEDQGTRNKIFSHMNICVHLSTEYGLDIIKVELTTWLKSRIIKKSLEDTTELFNGASRAKDATVAFTAVFNRFSQGNDDLINASFEENPNVSFDDITNGAFFQAKEAEFDNAMTFGCDIMDRKLNANAQKGSLLRGDHTIVMASTNTGKTSCMCSVIANNVFYYNRSILLITHEGRPQDIKTMLMQSLSGKSYGELSKMSQTADQARAMDILATWLSKYVVYIPMNRPGLTVEDVEAVIRQAQERRIITTGKGFDLLVDDYPAKLTTVKASQGHMQTRHIQEYIYNYFTQVALDMNMHVMTAIQTNRHGSEVNRGIKGAEQRLLTLEDVAEAFGPITTATNVITLNRSDLEKAQQRMTFHIGKSRGNDTGWSIITRTKFGVTRTHGFNLPCTYYRGISLQADSVDALLEQYSGKPLPDHMHH